MSTKPRTLARHAAQAFTATAMVAGGVVVVASPAQAVLSVPTIASVFVAGSTTNKVVTAGTTVLITGTGFTGMIDNSAVTARKRKVNNDQGKEKEIKNPKEKETGGKTKGTEKIRRTKVSRKETKSKGADRHHQTQADP